jgi:2-aminoadipate transaminase
VRLLVDVYRAKRDAMLRGLDEGLHGTDARVSRPEGGFFIWIKLPTGTDTRKLAEMAGAAGVQYTAGSAFFPNGGGEEHIRLAFSYEPPERCYQGALALARSVREARR